MQNSPQTKFEELTDRVETLSTTLRAKAVNFLTANFNKWEETWIPDREATVVTEGGPPAQDLDTFIRDVLPRPKRWVCGLCLAGVSLMQGCTIIVWQFKGSANETRNRALWKRAAIIRGRKESAKQVIIPVVLHYGHYYALRMPALRKSWPKEWALTKEEEESETAVSQDLENTQALSALCRGGCNEFCTPVKKRKQCDIDHFLRTCSSRDGTVEDWLRTCDSVKGQSSAGKTTGGSRSV